MILNNSVSILGAYLGPTAVQRIYLGDIMVFGNSVGYTIVADTATFELTLGDAQFSVGKTMTADPVSYTVTLGDAALKAARVLSAAPVSYTMTGNAAGILHHKKIVAEAATYSLTLGDAALIRSGSYINAAYSVGIAAAGGGSVDFGMNSDGSTYGDAAGWYSIITSGIGTGKWVIVTPTGGTLSVSGDAFGTRLELNVTRSWTGSYAGSSNRFADFTVQIYDAPTGGNLLASSTLHLEVDGVV